MGFNGFIVPYQNNIVVFQHSSIINNTLPSIELVDFNFKILVIMRSKIFKVGKSPYCWHMYLR